MRAGDLAADERAARKNIAANLLLSYAAGNPVLLTQLLLDADENQFPKFFEALATRQEDSVRWLLGQIENRGKTAHLLTLDETEQQAKRLANAGVYLMRVGRPESVWGLLKAVPDPRIRSYLIARLGRLTPDPRPLVERLAREDDVTVRAGLLQALGSFPDDRLSPAERAALIPVVRTHYAHDDAGLHAAGEWLLRKWGDGPWLTAEAQNRGREPVRRARLDALATEFAPRAGPLAPRWYVTGEGQTMVAVRGPVEFTAGSPKGEIGRLESEAQHPKRIGRSFAISSTLTTISQFDKLDAGAHSRDLPQAFKRSPDLPVVRATWFQVAAYCNWLSEREGIPPDQHCYRFNKDGTAGVRENYLDLPGYRLPTEAEYEYANRAGTTTGRCYGETEDLLGEYAWYARNSPEFTQPVGTRKPNDFGLFDTQGNAFTWCHDWIPRDEAHRTRPDDGSVREPAINSSDKRVLRGGAFYFMAISLRAARRHDDVPTMQGLYYGFRVARTLK